MIKVLLIAPYPGLAETTKKVNTPDDIQLDVKIANLEEGVRAAQIAEKQGYELIISRGGTATMIQNAVSIPVVHIDITGYDMLRVFTLIRGIKKGVALVGFPNISQGAATICNILEYDVKMVTIESRNEVRDRLVELKHQGYTVVIGDVITVQVAEQVGVRGFLITSGKEAVLDALEEAKRIHNYLSKVNDKIYYFKKVFKSIPLPLLLLNKDGEVIDENIMFEQDIKRHEILKSHIFSKLIKKVLENKVNQWAEIEIGNTTYEIQAFLVSSSEAIVGAIIHSSDIKTHTKSVEIIGNPVHIPIIGESRQAKLLRTNITQYAQNDGAVCIIGEPGTGKRTVAQAIHFKRYGQASPIVVIEGCNLIKGLEIDELQAKLLTIQRGTLLLKDIEAVPLEMQKSILNLLHHLPNTIKVIVLVKESLDKLVCDKKVDEDLYQKIARYPLHLSPLRDRKEDIGDFVDYFLAEFHAEDGNETVGMKLEGVKYLMAYDWSGNLPQLKRIVRELSMMNTANYIEITHVKELMNKYVLKEGNKNKIFPQGTLKEIEQQIIKQVMEEEGDNQSKVASRLGINRSTLWRKLKE